MSCHVEITQTGDKHPQQVLDVSVASPTHDQVSVDDKSVCLEARRYDTDSEFSGVGEVVSHTEVLDSLAPMRMSRKTDPKPSRGRGGPRGRGRGGKDSQREPAFRGPITEAEEIKRCGRCGSKDHKAASCPAGAPKRLVLEEIADQLDKAKAETDAAKEAGEILKIELEDLKRDPKQVMIEMLNEALGEDEFYLTLSESQLSRLLSLTRNLGQATIGEWACVLTAEEMKKYELHESYPGYSSSDYWVRHLESIIPSAFAPTRYIPADHPAYPALQALGANPLLGQCEGVAHLHFEMDGEASAELCLHAASLNIPRPRNHQYAMANLDVYYFAGGTWKSLAFQWYVDITLLYAVVDQSASVEQIEVILKRVGPTLQENDAGVFNSAVTSAAKMIVKSNRQSAGEDTAQAQLPGYTGTAPTRSQYQARQILNQVFLSFLFYSLLLGAVGSLLCLLGLIFWALFHLIGICLTVLRALLVVLRGLERVSLLFSGHSLLFWIILWTMFLVPILTLYLMKFLVCQILSMYGITLNPVGTISGKLLTRPMMFLIHLSYNAWILISSASLRMLSSIKNKLQSARIISRQQDSSMQEMTEQRLSLDQLEEQLIPLSSPTNILSRKFQSIKERPCYAIVLCVLVIAILSLIILLLNVLFKRSGWSM